jgi:hypothetical protein
VPAGSYTVEETNKPGYTDVGDTDGGNPNQISVTLTPGQSSTGNDFVDERPATLGDRVWEDTNANGVQDAGEAGIAGVTVQLKDENGAPVATTTTDASRQLQLHRHPGHLLGRHRGAGRLPRHHPNQGNDALDSDINAAGQTGPIVLSSGENDSSVDAGLYRAAELGDRVARHQRQRPADAAKPAWPASRSPCSTPTATPWAAPHDRRQRQLPLHRPAPRHLQRPVRQDHPAGGLQLHHRQHG